MFINKIYPAFTRKGRKENLILRGQMLAKILLGLEKKFVWNYQCLNTMDQIRA
uniref:Uncharacterized protein n=1 Tax=Rhizophora mucronata TaxID=61149 RepID=A0A2P2MPI7_RHIMU